MKVLLFAELAERLGAREFVLAAPAPGDVAALRARLAAEHAQLEGCVFRVAVNQGYALDDTALAPDDEVALIPPVSGG